MLRLQRVQLGKQIYAELKSMSSVAASKGSLIFREDGKPEHWENAKPYNQIPGPKSYPLIGSTLELLSGNFKNKTLPEIHAVCHELYGNLVKMDGIGGRDDAVLAFDPDDMELVYRTEGVWPIRRSFETFVHYRTKIRPDVYGETGGLLNEQGKAWHDMRTKVNPAMMQPKMVRQYVTPVEEVADEFIAKMLRLRGANQEMPANFDNEMNKWSLESIAMIAVETRLGCLKDDLPADSEPQQMIDSAITFFELLFYLEAMPPFWKIIGTPKYKKLMKAFDVMTEISLKYIDAAAKRIKENPHKSVDQESVLEKLLKIDKNVAIIMAMDMLLAGIDTTSSSTALLMYNLAKNPKAQDILREEIKTHLPNKDSKLAPGFINSIPYLRACMKESARMFPIIPGIVRKTGRDIILSGYQIPKGTDVLLSHYVLSNKDSQFGKASEFIPERWLVGKKATNTSEAKCPVSVPNAKDAHRFSYMPFGFGPRMCIGKRFAELEMEIFIMKLLRNYRLEWHHGDMKFKIAFLNTPASDLKYKMIEVE